MIECVLRSPAMALLARIVLTFPFWASGLAKLFDFTGTVNEMALFGLYPPEAIGISVIVVQLVGSALIILNRLTWLGAGALGIFTALTIPLVHHFWSITDEPAKTIAFHTAMEHIGMIGGLLVVAVLAAESRRMDAT
ncbi:DoxX family protein [Aureimonas fodinaquatilis]|uniref:DoxX family protein n=1 Tax=Aureimonas fodinaquatilis TaxID=2565783 RepID=A0A5B0DNV9_9HYPH|nr:DoxX family protein [Aureimonas fodinaquatilis]KAA0968434.1 DoxX family protein [Aureimonas fodinaquatilis]